MANLGSGGYDRALFQTSVYRSWVNMKTRCSNERSGEYQRYGARGITVCAKWQTFAGFHEATGLKSSTVRQRFYVLKWPIEKALGLEVCHR
jgi:hypothetical protein